jgi:hypothetical protein
VTPHELPSYIKASTLGAYCVRPRGRPAGGSSWSADPQVDLEEATSIGPGGGANNPGGSRGRPAGGPTAGTQRPTLMDDVSLTSR